MDNAEEPVREPEKLELPTAPSGEIRGAPEEPFFITLENEKRINKETFENSRRNSRIERIKKIQTIRNSKVIVYYSIGILDYSDSETLFDLLQRVGKQKRLDLFLLSPGGLAEPAYKMAVMCRSFAEENFATIIPHYAKSAATFLCLGADELVMGSASEIGPTDPRIEIKDDYGRKVNVSATSVEEALRVIEEYTESDPVKSLKYMPLIEKINLNTLGEYRRALNSSKQYAKELLKKGNLINSKSRVTSVANKLASNYYSHGYPITCEIVDKELGLNVTMADEDLWRAMWQLHKLYDSMIKESRDGKSMITKVFEAEGFLVNIVQQQSK